MGSTTSTRPAGIAVTSVRIEREKLDRFKQVADAHRRSVSQELRWLIDRAIEEADAQAAA
jgi:predicted DNA-binding protein